MRIFCGFFRHAVFHGRENLRNCFEIVKSGYSFFKVRNFGWSFQEISGQRRGRLRREGNLSSKSEYLPAKQVAPRKVGR